MAHLVYFIFVSDGGAPKCCGAQRKLSPFPSQSWILCIIIVSKYYQIWWQRF